MIADEIYNSDVIYMGGQILKVSDFKNKFPAWYETWNLYHRENDEKYILISDYEYGISATLNAVYKTDFEKAKAFFVCEIGTEKQGRNYHPPIRLENKMIFAPSIAKKWAYYDLQTQVWTYVDIPQEFYMKSDEVFIRSWKSIKDSIIYLAAGGIIVKLDDRNGEITYHNCLKKQMDDEDFSVMSLHKGLILLASGASDKIVALDAESMTISDVYSLGHNIKGIKTMCAIPKTNWLFFLENTDTAEPDGSCDVYKWNISTNELLKLDHLPVKSCGKTGKYLLSGFLYYKGNVYVTPCHGDCFIRINVENDAVERMEIELGHDFLERKNSFYRRWGDDMAFPMFAYNGFADTFTATIPYDYSIAEIDFINGRIYNRRKWQVNGIEGILKEDLAGRFDGGYYENEYYSLQNFLDEIVKNKKDVF